MNKHNAHLCLPLVQALAEGKQLQWKDGTGEWLDANEPKFLEPLRYRIKPEPREWWVLLTVNGSVGAVYPTEVSAQECARTTGCRAVQVREVL